MPIRTGFALPGAPVLTAGGAHAELPDALRGRPHVLLVNRGPS